jgi:hypothetical protein
LPSWIRIRIRNPARKREKAALYLAELLLLDHELDLLEGEAGSGSTDPIESGSTSDPDPKPCQKAGEKLLCTLPNSFFSTMSWICWKEKLDPDPLTLLNLDPVPQPRQKERRGCYLAQLLVLDHELDLVEGEAVLLQPEVQISQPEHVVVVQDQLRLLTG